MDRDLLPVPEKDFLTREQAERDDTVDIDEREDTPRIRKFERRER